MGKPGPDAKAVREAREDDTVDLDEPPEEPAYVFDEDEDRRPGERQREERWYEVVEERLRKLKGPEGKDRRTLAGVFDQRTMMTLYKFISNEVIETLDFPISTGKEADVFRATTPEGTHICVKIYRTNTATFHDVLQYIQGDPRFVGIKPEKHSLVSAWAQKEYRNLGRAVDAGARVPEPITCLSNILLMEYIGTDEGPYAIMKDAYVDDPERMAETVLGDYHKILVKGRLVHADISEYNILWADGEPVIIDIGQAVLLEHPMARDFLARDVANMSRFMTKMGARRDKKTVLLRALGPTYPDFETLLDATRPQRQARSADDGEE